jgi:hypothetical protein
MAVLLVGHKRDFSFQRFSLLSRVGKEYGWKVEELPGLGTQSPEGLTGRHPVLVVLGDSHAEHLKGSAQAAARQLGLGLEISLHPCAFTLVSPIAEDQACASVFSALDQARRGDVVLFSSLNVPRYVNQDGIPLPEPVPSAESIGARREALLQLIDVSRKLVKRGVAVIIKGPEPLFHFIPFRCSDWFNRGNEICSVPTSEPKAALLERARPALDSIAMLRKSVPEVKVWDVFQVLCPGERCSVYDAAGRPLFFDQDHLTGWGNAVLLPSLREILTSASRVAETR